MRKISTEKYAVQKRFIQYAEKIGWKYLPPGDAFLFRKGEEGKLFYEEAKKHLLLLNNAITHEDAEEIIRRIEVIPDTIEGNKKILDWVRGEQAVYVEKEQRDINIVLIDFDNVNNNTFSVTEEWTQINSFNKKNRMDMVFLVNGFPLAIVENKNPKKTEAMEEAIKQLRRYERETPEMMSCPQVFNITHLFEYFYGATWNYSRKNIFNWKKEIQEKRQKNISLEEAVTSFFNKKHFMALIKDWILFFFKENELQKTILKQHQTRAIEKILVRCRDRSKDRGLIWHTQGSGKTFTMISSARIILESSPNATVMMIIDRNELEGQLSEWIGTLFKSANSNQKIKFRSAKTKSDLKDILTSGFRGLIITMIHKFNDIKADICTRKDFYILIDEAHRSIGKDLGNYMMAALPNATIFGFTGTPVDKTEYGKGTFKIFGQKDERGYLDKYSIKESIEDGTTLKLRHTVVENEMTLCGDLLEKEFFNRAASEGISDIDDLNKVLRKAVKLRTFLKNDDRIQTTTQYMANHFKSNVQPLGYKAFVVAVDREACAVYKRALDKFLPSEMSRIVYSKGQNDSSMISNYIMTEDEEKKIRKNFKKENTNPQILIVTDKLLTGYDAPVLYCMYLDKPMRDHILLQAIARVNRPYEDSKGIEKPCGMIMDFVGIFKSMRKALSFDPDEVDAIIENMDDLMRNFQEKIDNYKRFIPSQGKGDRSIEKLVYEDFSDMKKRKDFIKNVNNLESMYEILSPDKRLRDYMSGYQNIIEIRELLKNAYSGDTKFLGGLSRKTEKLIQESPAKVASFAGKIFEINTETLERIKKDGESSPKIKIMNLIKAINKECQTETKEELALISIAKKANDILDRFKEDQSESKRFLEYLLSLSEEVVAIKAINEKIRLEKNSFLAYWILQKEGLKNARELALEIDGCFQKFEHFGQSKDEFRELKIEIYKVLIPFIKGDKLIKIVDHILQGGQDEN